MIKTVQTVAVAAFLLGSSGMVFAATKAEIEQRLQPVAKVATAENPAVAPAATAAVGKTPETIFQTKCSVCHTAGVANAPKMGDKAEWDKRLAATGESDPAKQVDSLLKVAIAGKGAMPARGTCMDCTDDELKQTIQYMINGDKK